MQTARQLGLALLLAIAMLVSLTSPAVATGQPKLVQYDDITMYSPENDQLVCDSEGRINFSWWSDPIHHGPWPNTMVSVQFITDHNGEVLLTNTDIPDPQVFEDNEVFRGSWTVKPPAGAKYLRVWLHGEKYDQHGNKVEEFWSDKDIWIPDCPKPTTTTMASTTTSTAPSTTATTVASTTVTTASTTTSTANTGTDPIPDTDIVEAPGQRGFNWLLFVLVAAALATAILLIIVVAAPQLVPIRSRRR